MIDLTVAREEYLERLKRAVQALPDRLSSMPEVERAIVFGSYARGRRDLGTDLDLLLVVNSEAPFVERVAEYHRRLRFGVDMDVVAYTPAELGRMADRSFVRRALEEGSVIYEKRSG